MEASASLPSLAMSEVDRLAECEQTIERGLATFVEVGAALLEIRDSRLYREAYGTFEDYCRERWGMDRRNANRHIEAAAVVGSIDPTLPSPANVAVTRELAALRSEPEQLREAWSEAVERHGERPTAAEVRDVVTELRPTPRPPEPREPYQPGAITAEEPPTSADRMAVHYSSATDEWATPQDFFDAVAREFSFELDVCALPSSAKCERYFGPEDDGLTQDWTGVCWMNPPYGDVIGQWMRKAWESAQSGATVACLVPARTDTAWWHDYCGDAEVRFLKGRLRFGTADASAPFPSALVILGAGYGPRMFNWDWRR